MTLGSNTSGHLFDTSFTTNGVLYSANSGVITSTSAGTATYVLTSNGSGSAPTFQPAPVALFQAYLSATATNVSGDGTVYTIAFNSTAWNVGSCFNTGTYTFTAPTTGKYLFTGTTWSTDFTVAHTQAYQLLVTTGGNYNLYSVNPYVVAGNGTLQLSWSATVSMSSGNTATLSYGAVGGTKIVDIAGTQGATTFSGSYISV
jgi:hypothetical protein